MQQAQPLPNLDPGLTRLQVATPRSAAFYQLVGAAVCDVTGRTLWIDARNHASTRALSEHVSRPSRLDGLHVARAFTAYQHHALVRDLPGQASSRTAMIVAPAVADRYRDADVPEYETGRLFSATLTILAETAASLDVPVLVTTVAEDELAARVDEYADRTIEATGTEMGVAYDGPAFQTDVYVQAGWWQTTIPYWVDLLGAVGDDAPVEATFGELATLEG